VEAVGPYLAERAWGTVREDYGPGPKGDAWRYFSHDAARCRAYRWNEDVLCGICDNRQLLCVALALWNGRDQSVKERMFGLTNHEGNHGEDVKEYRWYLDSTPTHSWMVWRYHYPQDRFPEDQLRTVNASRGKADSEFELLDTGIFKDNRYWVVTVEVAKAAPSDISFRIRVRNAGPSDETLHVLPTIWFVLHRMREPSEECGR
jgi:hypothetical protein